MSLKTILDADCHCPCHASHKLPFQRPTMTQLHHAIDMRQWCTVRQAIRLDASVAMRHDDSENEDAWFSAARMAAWRRSGAGRSCPSHREGVVSLKRKKDEDSTSVQYWVCRVDFSHRITLLHSICRKKFYSEEGGIVQLSQGEGEELRDLTSALKTIEMIIDASHNELRPINAEEDYYHELEDGETEKLADGFLSPCQQCSCYYLSQYCPPVGLYPGERYNPQDCSRATENAPKKLHESVMTMTEGLCATPLHVLTRTDSAHVDIVRVFLEKCRPWSGDARRGECGRRPTVYDLLWAQNVHGCTPMHFLSDGTNDDVLRLILDRLETERITNDPNRNPNDAGHMPLHPLLIQDRYGDLPLHNATRAGAPASLLSIMTTYPGTFRAAVISNAQGKLPIDELIVWYKEFLYGEHESEDENENNGGNHDHNDEDDVSESSEEDEREEDGNDQTHASQGCPVKTFMRAIQLMLFDLREHSSAEGIKPAEISLSSHFQCHLWDRMCLLIQAAANSIVSSATGTTAFFHSSDHQWNPIPASIIASKYCDFPAFSLVSSILMAVDDMDASSAENHCDINQRISQALLQKDSFGLLPLHWACGDIAHLLSSSNIKFCGISDLEQHPVSTCPETARWRDQELCSMIQHLLHLCPKSARVPTPAGRLPLHLFLDGGYAEQYRREDLNSSERVYVWDDVKALLDACPEALRTPDICSNMYPFQIAAAAETSTLQLKGERSVDRKGWHAGEGAGLDSLEMTYRLIREDPSLCCALYNRHGEP